MGAAFLGRLVAALAQVLGTLLSTYFWILFIAVLLTWVQPDPRNPIVRFLYSVTEPVLYQVRRRLPFVVVGGWDLSPLVVMLAIQVLQQVVVGTLFDLSYQLQMSAHAG